MATISTIQFKRGTKSALEKNLISSKLGVLLQGEPAFEVDTGKLKIGDGLTDYPELGYIESDDKRFVIHDPVANQVLLYDEALGKWVNKDLTDENSLVYLDNNGLTIKGYNEAKQGQILTKDAEAGLIWKNPVDTTQLNEAVAAATAKATEASNAALAANNSAVDADRSAKTSEIINQQTMNFVNEKFWWGTLEEYNKLESITEGTIYLVRI